MFYVQEMSAANGGSLLNAIGEGNRIQLLHLLDSEGIDLEQKDQVRKKFSLKLIVLVCQLYF